MELTLSDTQDTLTPMHPALAVMGDTLYVAVEVADENLGIVDVILTSAGEAFTPREWEQECRRLGIQPYATVNLNECKARWNNQGVRELVAGELTAPTWQDTYNAIQQALDERIEVVDRRHLTVLTLHVMLTYVYILFDFLPILWPLGPSESGKSRAGDAEKHLAFNGVKEGSATRAVIFRLAHQGCYTQILAEADHLAYKDSDDDFVRDLQACCSKGEATVHVAEGSGGKKYIPTTYYGFSPRVITSTKKFKSRPLRNRCIRLDFVKTPNADQSKLRRTMNDDSVWAPLRDMLYRLQLVRWWEVADARDSLIETWHGADAPKGRVFDKWLPLASIAALLSEDVLTEVKQLAMEDLNEQRQDAAGDFSAVLFKFLYHYVHDKEGDTIKATRADLWKAFLNDYDKNDSTYRPPKWLKATGATATPEELSKWFRGQGVLVKELQILHLMPKEAVHSREGNHYLLDKRHVMGTVEAYLGDYTLAAEGEDPMECSDCGRRMAVDRNPRRPDGKRRCDTCETKERAA